MVSAKQDKVIFSRVFWSTVWMLSVSLAPFGCDRQGADADHRWGVVQDTNGGIQASYQENGEFPASASRVDIIRVFLQTTDDLVISNDEADCGVWEGNGAEAKLIFHLLQGEKCRIQLNGGWWSLEDRRGRNFLPDRIVTSEMIEIRPETEGIFTLESENQDRYRGTLRFIKGAEGQITLVNELHIETYLAGVVGAEMPALWPKAALQAQAIASRTYAMYQKQKRRNQGNWDIGNNQRSQVYKGLDREHDRVDEVLKETRGVVLAFGPNGSERIFPSYYSSVCGGYTQDSARVFGENITPLSGDECPYCVEAARPELYRWGRVVFAKETVSQRLMERFEDLQDLGEIVGIRVTSRSGYGRVEELELTGSSGESRKIRADNFRSTISRSDEPLRSSWYRLVDGGREWRFEDGRGWGHGVGMCQYGSKEMADQGYDCMGILNHYYSGAIIARAY